VTGFSDLDGDGHYERVFRDTDGDGTTDGVEEDVNGDGVADRFGVGLGPDDPFGEPQLWVDNLPEPRDGITEPLVETPLGPDALAFGAGMVAPAAVPERDMDYEREALDEEAAAYVDPPAGRYAIEEPPAETSDVDTDYAGPAFPPLAEASDVNDAMADPDDDAYVGRPPEASARWAS
jgi:hypothetical protein